MLSRQWTLSLPLDPPTHTRHDAPRIQNLTPAREHSDSTRMHGIPHPSLHPSIVDIPISPSHLRISLYNTPAQACLIICLVSPLPSHALPGSECDTRSVDCIAVVLCCIFAPSQFDVVLLASAPSECVPPLVCLRAFVPSVWTLKPGFKLRTHLRKS